MAEALKRDQNHVTVQGAVTDDANLTVEPWKVDATTKRLLVNAVVAGSENGKILVSADDTTYEYLETKLVAGNNITLTVLNPGGNETLEIAATDGYLTIEDGGVALPQEPILNFVNYFTVTDEPGATRTNISINVTELAGDAIFISELENNLDLANISGLIDLSTQVTGLLSATNIDINNLESTLNLGDISGQINLATQVTGQLSLTNLPTLADGTIIIGDGVGSPTSLAAFTSSTGALKLANGGTGASLVDPNADRIFFWDDSAGSTAFLTVGTGLSISGTTITATGSGNAIDVQQDGVAIAAVTTLNFTGGVTVTESPVGTALIDITGGGNGGGTKIAIDTTVISAGGGGSDSYTEVIPGGTLGTNNAIRYKILLSQVTVDGNPGLTVAATYGGVAAGTAILRDNGGGENGNAVIEGFIVADGATNAQKGFVSNVFGTGLTNAGDSNSSAQDYDAIAGVDSTVDQNLVVTLTCAGGTATTFTAQAIVVEKITDGGEIGNKKVGVGEFSDTTWYNVQHLFSLAQDGSANLAGMWEVDTAGNILSPNIFTTQANGGQFYGNDDIYTTLLPDLDEGDGKLKFDAGKQVIFQANVFTTAVSGTNKGGIGWNGWGATSGNTIPNLQGTNTLSLGFVRDSAGQWYARAADGAANTETSITISSGASHVLRCEYDPANATPQARFYVDGVLVATITTNLPTASATVMGFSGGNAAAASEQATAFIMAPSFAVEI